MKKYLAELIGTFFLAYVVGHNAMGGGVLAPVAVGAALAAMVYACAHLSGGHFNPAVTIAVWLRGRCDARDVVPYILCQLVGAVLAAVAVSWMRGKAEVPADLALSRLIMGEIFGSFALAWVVLNVTTTQAPANLGLQGPAAGLTVIAGASSVGSLAAAAFNPAVATAAVGMNLLNGSQLWVYWVFCIAGGGAAAFVVKKLKADE